MYLKLTVSVSGEKNQNIFASKPSGPVLQRKLNSQQTNKKTATDIQIYY